MRNSKKINDRWWVDGKVVILPAQINAVKQKTSPRATSSSKNHTFFVSQLTTRTAPMASARIYASEQIASDSPVSGHVGIQLTHAAAHPYRPRSFPIASLVTPGGRGYVSSIPFASGGWHCNHVKITAGRSMAKRKFVKRMNEIEKTFTIPYKSLEGAAVTKKNVKNKLCSGVLTWYTLNDDQLYAFERKMDGTEFQQNVFMKMKKDYSLSTT